MASDPWMAGSTAGVILTSATGVTWTSRAVLGTGNVHGLAYNNGLYVAVVSNIAAFWTSTDQITWTSRATVGGLFFNCVFYFPQSNLWVAGSTSTGVILSSTDGITWTSRGVTQAATVTWIAFNGTTYVASAQGVWTSTNLTAWTSRATVASPIAGQSLYDGSKFLEADGAGPGAVWTSPTGTTWTSRTVPEAATQQCQGIAYNGTNLYAVVGINSSGSNTGGSSADGLTWTSRTIIAAVASITKVVYGGGLFITNWTTAAVTAVMASSDAITWTSRGVGAGPIQTVYYVPQAANLGWELTVGDDFPFQAGPRRHRTRLGAMRQQVGFSYTAPWVNQGNEQVTSQPPNPAVRNRARAGSAIRSRSEFAYPIGAWVNQGNEQVQSQPKVYHARKEAVLDVGDQGNQALYVFTPPVSVLGDFTYDENRYLRRPRPGMAIMRGDDGAQAPFAYWINVGSEVQPPQPPHPIVRHRGAIMRGDDGNQNRYQFWINVGSEVQPLQPPHPIVRHRGTIIRGDDGNQRPYQFWINVGFEVQPPQPPHPIVRQRGAIMRGDDGNQFPYIFWINGGSQIQPFQPPYRLAPQRGAILRGDDGTQAPFIQFTDFGFENQSPQPPAFRRKFSLVGNDGIDNVFTLTPAAPITWWESNIADLRFLRRMQSLVGDDGIQGQYVSWLNSGFEPILFQPPVFRRKFSFVGDDGIQGRYERWINGGSQIQPFQPPHPKPETRFAGLVGGDFGAWNPFVFINHGWPAIYPQPPHPKPELRWGATVGGDFGAWNPFAFTDHGWPAIYPQPPHPRPERSGAIARGDDGNQAIYQALLIPYNWGMEVAPVQPPITRQYRFAGLVGGDFGAWYPISWTNHGWPANFPQPPHPRPERSGAIARGDEGNQGVFRLVTIPLNWGFEIQPVQPPAFTRPRRFAGMVGGDFGAWNPFVFINYGWPIIPFQPPAFTRPRRFAGTVGGDFGAWRSIGWTDHGWPAIYPQPPHPRPERAGAIARGDEGNEGLFIKFTIPKNWGFEPFLHQPQHPRPERWAAIAPWSDGMNTMPVIIIPPNWVDVHQVQPPRFRWTGLVAATKGKALFAVYPPFLSYGWEVAPFQPPYRSAPQKIEGTRGKTLFAIFRGQLYGGWESNPFQPPHPRPEQRGASIRFRSGYAVYPPFPDYGFWVDQPQPPHPRPERSGAIQRGDDGTQAAFNLNAVPYNWGFDPQAFQPPAFTLSLRGTAITKDDGIQGVYVNWQNVGSWEQLPEQPPRLRYEKAGAIAVGDVGAWDTFQPWTSVGFEPWLGTPSYAQPQRLRAAAIMRGDDGNALGLAKWINAGWEIQSVRPPHPKPEQRFAGLVGGDVGVDTYHRWFDYGWFVPQPQPPHPRPERWAAIARGDDGNQFPFVKFQVLLNWGFEIQPVQPPAFNRARRGVAVRSEDGTEAPYINWRNSGWEFVTSQPRHPRPERSGAIARWEPANYNRFQLLPTINHEWGYEPNPFQPPRRKWERAAGMRGARGGFAIYPLTVINAGAFTPSIPDVRMLFKHRSYRLLVDEAYDKFEFVPVRGFDGWEPVLPDVRWPKVRHHFDADTNNNGPHRVLVVFPPDFWVTVPPRCTTAVATARQLIVLAQPRCIVAYAEPD